MNTTTGVRFPPRLRRTLAARAAQSGIRPAELIRTAVAEFLKTHRTAEAVIAAVCQARTEGGK